MGPHRAILEAPEFIEARRALGINLRRLDEIIEGVGEVVARKPDEFPRVHGTELRRVKTRPFRPNIPSYGIFFAYDDQTVWLRHIYNADLLEDVGLNGPD